MSSIFFIFFYCLDPPTVKVWGFVGIIKNKDYLNDISLNLHNHYNNEMKCYSKRSDDAEKNRSSKIIIIIYRIYIKKYKYN